MSTRPTTEDIFTGNGRAQDKSAGRLMKEVTEDLSTLVRKEVELAKQEIGQSVAEKVKGGVIIAIAGTFAFFALIFGLLALRDGLDNFLWTWVADLVTTGALLLLGGLAALIAVKKLKKPISAEMTKDSIKEDVQWAKTLGKH